MVACLAHTVPPATQDFLEQDEDPRQLVLRRLTPTEYRDSEKSSRTKKFPEAPLCLEGSRILQNRRRRPIFTAD